MDPLDEGSIANAIDAATSRPAPAIPFLPTSTLRDDVVDAVSRAIKDS